MTAEFDQTIAALVTALERVHERREKRLPTIPIGTRVRVRNMGVGTVVGRDGYGFDGVAVIFDPPAPRGFEVGCCAGVAECEVLRKSPATPCPTCAHPEGYDRLSGPCPTCHGDGLIPPVSQTSDGPR